MSPSQDGCFELIVLDFQTLQVSCPALDLIYFIFSGTDKAFRKDHYQMLIDYYTQLAAAMNRLGLDPEVYTREDFDFELKEVGLYHSIYEIMACRLVQPHTRLLLIYCRRIFKLPTCSVTV